MFSFRSRRRIQPLARGLCRCRTSPATRSTGPNEGLNTLHEDDQYTGNSH